MQRKWEANYYLGEVFLGKKNFALAEKSLADAANDVSGEDNKKKVIFLRGRVAEEKGDIAQALDFYNEVASMDYGYEDVAKRIDELNAKA
jgi:TolA-binding protein